MEAPGVIITLCFFKKYVLWLMLREHRRNTLDNQRNGQVENLFCWLNCKQNVKIIYQMPVSSLELVSPVQHLWSPVHITVLFFLLLPVCFHTFINGRQQHACPWYFHWGSIKEHSFPSALMTLGRAHWSIAIHGSCGLWPSIAGFSYLSQEQRCWALAKWKGQK